MEFIVVACDTPSVYCCSNLFQRSTLTPIKGRDATTPSITKAKREDAQLAIYSFDSSYVRGLFRMNDALGTGVDHCMQGMEKSGRQSEVLSS